MKILVDQSGYSLQNMGDISMLQVALSRLNQLFPNASIQVFTTAPDRLTYYCPTAQPLSLQGRSQWFGPLTPYLHKILPNGWVSQNLVGLEWRVRSQIPSLTQSLLNLKLKLQNNPERIEELEEFTQAFLNADLVIATGGGYITDSFVELAAVVLTTLGLAVHLGKTTAMFGQGLGPIQKPELFTKAKNFLPTLDLIALREKRASFPLLNTIGVSSDRLIVTGDDAIELAYNSRQEEPGVAIGVNLRVATYSDINTTLIETIRLALQKFARQQNAPLLPIPIDHASHEGYGKADSATIQILLKGYDDTSDGGKSLDTPQKVIEQVSHCRLVVTGSYHAGVFALSQGIPVVGLAKSEYYANKFLGLADQFGTGCEVVFLNDQNLSETLTHRMQLAWDSGEQVRSQLLQTAQYQIELGHRAYRQIYELVRSRINYPVAG